MQQDVQDWLREGISERLSVEEALRFFDSLPAINTGDMVGEWKGASLPTSNPLDGLLEELGWEGKAVIDSENVHPLIFRNRRNEPYSLNSKQIPISLLPLASTMARSELVASLLSRMGPALKTEEPTARLRTVEYRGVTTATMIYDYLPINDIFRKIDDNMVLGVMDMRDAPDPFFFILKKNETPSSFYESLRVKSRSDH